MAADLGHHLPYGLDGAADGRGGRADLCRLLGADRHALAQATHLLGQRGQGLVDARRRLGGLSRQVFDFARHHREAPSPPPPPPPQQGKKKKKSSLVLTSAFFFFKEFLFVAKMAVIQM